MEAGVGYYQYAGEDGGWCLWVATCTSPASGTVSNWKIYSQTTPTPTPAPAPAGDLSRYAQLKMRCSGGQVGLANVQKIVVNTTEQCAYHCDNTFECTAFVIWEKGTACYLKKECKGPEGPCPQPKWGCGYRRSITGATLAQTHALWTTVDE